MRKPVYAICKQQRCRSACASPQSDQRLYCSIPILAIANFSRLASLCSWVGWLESYLVTNPWRPFFSWRGSVGLSGVAAQVQTPFTLKWESQVLLMDGQVLSFRALLRPLTFLSGLSGNVLKRSKMIVKSSVKNLKPNSRLWIGIYTFDGLKHLLIAKGKGGWIFKGDFHVPAASARQA